MIDYAAWDYVPSEKYMGEENFAFLVLYFATCLVAMYSTMQLNMLSPTAASD